MAPRSQSVPISPGLSQLVRDGLIWSQMVSYGLIWSQRVLDGLIWSQMVSDGLRWSQMVSDFLGWSVLVTIKWFKKAGLDGRMDLQVFAGIEHLTVLIKCRVRN